MLRTNLLGLATRARPAFAVQPVIVRNAYFSSTTQASAKRQASQDATKASGESPFNIVTDKASGNASNVLPSSMSLFGSSKNQQPSLAPYTGRSLNVFHNVNSTYRRLNSILAQNNVRRELRANDYYEKPNVARRRKKIEQNKKLFGALVRKKVALIMQMKQRGM